MENQNYELVEGDWNEGLFTGKAKYNYEGGDFYEG